MKLREKPVERKRAFAVEFAFESRKRGLGRALDQLAVGVKKSALRARNERGRVKSVKSVKTSRSIVPSEERSELASSPVSAALYSLTSSDDAAGSPTVASAVNGRVDATSDASAIRARPTRRKSKERLNARE